MNYPANYRYSLEEQKTTQSKHEFISTRALLRVMNVVKMQFK
jgi:hypothetical protein